jgi:PI-3-kinase-related kinase SMG-1
LNFNFHTIILPEALKTIQTEEPTVLAMVNELDDIIAGVGCPLEDLLAQLEMHLRYIIMEMDVSSQLKLLRRSQIINLTGIFSLLFLFCKV